MLSSDKYCVLIVLSPRWSIATYFDSGSLKDYTKIKAVLDEALEGYAQKGGHFDVEKNGERFSKEKKHIFSHATTFHCIKHAPDSVKDAFYVLHHIKRLVRDAELARLPSSLQQWTKFIGDISDADLREEFHRIQMQLSHIIKEDVMTEGGSLHNSRGNLSISQIYIPIHSIYY